MRFDTPFGMLRLEWDELKLVERLTGLREGLAVNELAISMVEEMVWPDQETVRLYLSKLKEKEHGKRI